MSRRLHHDAATATEPAARVAARRWAAASEHAQILREARELAGLTQRQLAERMGVSWVTVRQAEMGRDLRHATLQRFLAALPVLDASALLLGRRHGVPPSRLSAWRALADLVGFSSSAVSRTIALQPDGARWDVARVTGLRGLQDVRAGETVRRDLMMAACEGSGSALPHVLVAAGEPSPEALTFEADGLRHAYRIHAEQGAERIDYRCTSRREADASAIPSVLEPGDALRMGLLARATHPTEALRFRLRLPPGLRPASPVVIAWPEALLPGERDLAARHHGGAVPVRLRREGSDLAFDVARPLPGTCYAACWDGLGDDGRRVTFDAGRRATPALSVRLREAREAAGLSRRALAARMGAAEVVVRTAEQGRDVRRSTLQGYLRALPALRASDLLHGDAATSMTREELRRHWLDFFGCEADEEHKTMIVRPNGDCEIVHVVRGLRTLPGRARALRLLDAQQPSYYAHEPPRCRRMDVPEGDAEGIRTRLHLRPDGRVVQEVALPEALAEQGAAFRREIVRSGVFHLTAERARALRGVDSGAVQDGAMLYSLFPARRRVLEVRFPEGYWPRRVVAHAWPVAAPPYPEHHEVGGRLHPPRLSPQLSRARSRVSLRIAEPEVGFKYALVWDLP